MRFDSKRGKQAGKISKRGTALGVELRGSLNELVNKIINDLDYKTLSASQKIKLLDVALKYSLPRLSIQKNLTEYDNEQPRAFEFGIVDNGKVIETHKGTMGKDFKFKDLLGSE